MHYPTAPNVAAAFEVFPAPERKTLLRLRDVIFEVAKSDARIGPLQETLRWGQPSYLTATTKSGTAIRLALTKKGECALFTHCQTTVMSDFRNQFPDEFAYEDNRALIPGAGFEDKIALLSMFMVAAMTYHRKKVA